MTYKKIVKETLGNFPTSRDDDQYLYATVLNLLGFNVRQKLAIDLVTEIRNKKLPSLDTISRIRRNIQQRAPHLRGKEWEVRQTKKQQKVLEDLGYRKFSC